MGAKNSTDQSGVDIDTGQLIAVQKNVITAAGKGKLVAIKKVLQPCKEDQVKWLLSQEVDKTTPLIVACRNGHTDVASYLIQDYGADIEQTGSVTFDTETHEGATPLWCAAAAGHFPTVEMLVRNGAEVNHKTSSESTPLRAACFDGHFEIVKLLVEHGADIELANKHDHTCLMISCYKNHHPIVEYLVELGADVNRKSVRGNTALHECAESGSLKIMQLLLKNDARMVTNLDGLCPLKTAAVEGQASIVDYLVERRDGDHTLNDKIASLELVGATFVDKKKDMQSALKYWNRAIELRKEHPTKIVHKKKVDPVAAYDYATEFRSKPDLDNLVCDPEQMKLQALLIRERILGPAHPDTTYYIMYRGAVFADNGDYDRCIPVWMYALQIGQRVLEPLSNMTQNSLLSFARVFAVMIEKNTDHHNTILDFSDVCAVYERAVLELFRFANSSPINPMNKEDTLGHNMVLTLLLHLLALVIKRESSGTTEQQQRFKEKTKQLVQKDFRGIHGSSLLHMALSESTSDVGEYTICKFPDYKVASCLLECGADPNVTDSEGNSSLHIAVRSLDAMTNPTTTSDILKLVDTLLQYGAQFDLVNNKGECFLDLSRVAHTHLLELKYAGHLPQRLDSFVTSTLNQDQ